jgi:predicted ribonuclease YlaK
LLPKLEQLVGAGGTPAEISEGTTLEVMIEVGRRLRPVDADEEILDTCTELRQFSGQAEDITLVTGDTAMRMRAEALGGIRTVALADFYGRDVDRSSDTSSA